MIDKSYNSVITKIIQVTKVTSDLNRLGWETAGVSEIEECMNKNAADMGLIALAQQGILCIVPHDKHDHIEPFQHPILLSDTASSRAKVAVDARPYMRLDDKDVLKFKVTDPIGLVMAVLRGLLEVKWQQPNVRVDLLWSTGKVTAKVYNSWVSNALQSARQLTPLESFKVRIVTEAFWMDSHSIKPIHNNERATRIARNLNISITEVTNLLEGHDYMLDLEDYLRVLKDVTQSLRLDTLDVSVLAQILNNAWYGPQSRPVSVLAIEYPPAFHSMLLTIGCVGESWLFRSSGIGRVIKNLGRQEDDLKKLPRVVGNLLNLK